MTTSFPRHGGQLAQACARFGGAPEDWLDLSTGINPNGWTPPADLTVEWQRLPEPDALAALEAAAARHFGCDEAICVAVPGSEMALRLLAQLIGLRGLHRAPCYGTYRAAFSRSENLTQLATLPARSTALVVGNPNNPDGTVQSRTSLLAMLDHQERHGSWLIVDEAFADCDPTLSVADAVQEGRRLIVLRSLGKFFGLAGLRLGFVIAPPRILDALRMLLGDWPLHSAALALGRAAYANHAWIAQTRNALPLVSARLDKVLLKHGLAPEGQCPLFRLIDTPSAPALFERLAAQRILTRPFSDWPHLLRIGLPADQTALDRLDKALG